jgi:ComF family protein
MSFLDVLFATLFPPRDGEARVRDTSLDSLAPIVEPTLHVLGSLSVTALLPYREPSVRACIREAKFHTNRRAHKLLGAVLAEYLQELVREREAFLQTPLVVIPIPLSATRKRQRGHNQTESIACAALRGSTIPVRLDTRLLRRIRDTAPQTSLSKAVRHINMKDVFVATRKPDPTHTYIVFDDVSTTGATLEAAHAALRASGAASILLISLAH